MTAKLKECDTVCKEVVEVTVKVEEIKSEIKDLTVGFKEFSDKLSGYNTIVSTMNSELSNFAKDIKEKFNNQNKSKFARLQNLWYPLVVAIFSVCLTLIVTHYIDVNYTKTNVQQKVVSKP